MPNISTTEEFVQQFTPVDRRLKHSFAAFGEVALGVWSNCQGKLAGNASYNKSSVKVKAEYLSSMFYHCEREWAKDTKSQGYMCAFGDACCESIASEVDDLRKLLTANYKNASIQDYELMAWIHTTLILLEACVKNYDLQITEVKQRFGVDSLIKAAYGKYNMEKLFKAIEFIFNKVWNKARAKRTINDYHINNDSPECHEAFYKISRLLSDPLWLSDKTIKAQLLYEDSSNGYKEIE